MAANDESKRFKELEQCINEYQDQLFRFAFFRTGSVADSEDLVQDVFVKLYRSQRQQAPVKNIKHYLFRSIANACTDFQRKGKYHFESVEKIEDSTTLQVKDASWPLLLKEEYNRIESLLQHLPEEQAEIIRLRVLDHLNFTEIAVLLSQPVTTVKSRFKYGIDKLKNILHPKEIIYDL